MRKKRIAYYCQSRQFQNPLQRLIAQYCLNIFLRKSPIPKFSFPAGAISNIQKPLFQQELNLNQGNKYGPFVWVVYHEYVSRFGIGYMLNSNAVGIRLNDNTSMISSFDFKNFKYFDKAALKKHPSQLQQVYTQEKMPKQLAKKFKIIDYYKKQLKTKKEEDEGKMCNEQIIQKEKLRFRETAEKMMQVFVVKYYQNSNVTIFRFNNKDCQLMFNDSTEVLLSKGYITYVNKMGNRTCFDKKERSSQSQEIQLKLKQATQQIKNMYMINQD